MEEPVIDKKESNKSENTSKKMSIRSILGGDILANDFFKRQTRLLILIMILTVLYIDNRYSSQQELIEIDRLKKELDDVKYDALTRSSELMEKSRQSKIEEYISTQGSELQTATNRPYLIVIDEK
ncbi:FtsL-like putative cell division protein [Phocaeicola paurosaccharolyticus]|jgi:hypothetical protein|uniref:FtsL-like putative cell division protein n=1 Tax=Phocaeicola paurosaccharolyticus TaxID=732242 RepID=UPI00046A13EB|nr:FtsL-like putative cell division protein [Phocaeicola paurosaccharolyticus]